MYNSGIILQIWNMEKFWPFSVILKRSDTLFAIVSLNILCKTMSPWAWNKGEVGQFWQTISRTSPSRMIPATCRLVCDICTSLHVQTVCVTDVLENSVLPAHFKIVKFNYKFQINNWKMLAAVLILKFYCAFVS